MKRLCITVCTVLALVVLAVPQRAPVTAHAGAASIGLPDGRASSTNDPPLTAAPFSPITLTGTAGTITAVVYEGANTLIPPTSADSTVTMTGFTVPAGAGARTTYVVADGQCSVDAPNGCITTTPSGGSHDTLNFSEPSGPTFNDGPDAFKGRGSDHQDISDPGAGCPWGAPPNGGDNCLWDTRTFDVSAVQVPGATSATAVVHAVDDCLTHEAQIFAVGPAAAFTDAGYAASGKALRDHGSGTITIAGIPPGSTINKAVLYWNVLNNTDPGPGMLLNGVSTPGTPIGSDRSPCWGQASTSFSYRADVTAMVPGNGSYALTCGNTSLPGCLPGGYPTGEVDGISPFVSGSPTPEMEGASLIVFYSAPAPTCKENDGEGNMKDDHSDKHRDDNKDVHVKSDQDDNQDCEKQDQEESGDDHGDQQEIDTHDNRDGSDFHSTRIDSIDLSLSGKKATITGSGVHAGNVVTFVAVEIDNGPQAPGFFSLQLSDGYNIAGSLVDGAIHLS